MTTTTSAPRKKPQDRQPTKSEQMREERPPGADLLKPAVRLRSGEQVLLQADLMELFAALGVDLEPKDTDPDADEAEGNEESDQPEFAIETTPDTLRAVAKMGSILESYSTDLDAYIEFDTGPEASQRILTLGMWYLGQLGESVSSAS